MEILLTTLLLLTTFELTNIECTNSMQIPWKQSENLHRQNKRKIFKCLNKYQRYLIPGEIFNDENKARDITGILKHL